jgi:hypothetical protein
MLGMYCWTISVVGVDPAGFAIDNLQFRGFLKPAGSLTPSSREPRRGARRYATAWVPGKDEPGCH